MKKTIFIWTLSIILFSTINMCYSQVIKEQDNAKISKSEIELKKEIKNELKEELKKDKTFNFALAISTVLLSGIFSYLVSRYNYRATLLSKPLDAYSCELQSKRIEKYQKVYSLLSDLGKLIFLDNNHKISAEDLKEGLLRIYRDIELYDSEVSLFYSAKTGYYSAVFREKLTEIAHESNFEKFTKKEMEISYLEEFREKFAASFEVCLKTDIGIYEMEMYNTKTNFSYFTYEKEMKEKSEKEINKKSLKN